MVSEGVYCRGCGEEDYVCRQLPCNDVNCDCLGTAVIAPNGLQLIPHEPIDFTRFGECVAWFSWMMRLQLIYSTASDEMFAAKHWKAFSSKRRLAVVAALCNAESLEVQSDVSGDEGTGEGGGATGMDERDT